MFCAKCGLLRNDYNAKRNYQASCPQIINGAEGNFAKPLYSPYISQPGLINNGDKMNEQLLQLEDGYIKEIIVQILPALSKKNMQKQSKLLVHGIVVTHAIDRFGLISDHSLNENSFQHEFLLPSEIDNDRVTWVLQSQTNINHPIKDKFTEHNQLVIKAPFMRRAASSDYLCDERNVHVNTMVNGKISDFPQYHFSCDCKGNEFETSEMVINKYPNQLTKTRLLCMNDSEEGEVLINRQKTAPTFLHHKMEESSEKEAVQTVNVEGSDSEGSKINFPLRMSDQPALYHLTDEGCELIEELDFDIDQKSLRIHMKKQQGKIWLTFAKELVQQNTSDKSKTYVDTYKLRTTSRREYKLNPMKFDMSKIKARTTNGKLIIKVPFRKE